MVKAYCGELVNEVMYACLQFHGGMGYMRESTIERMARDARVQAIGGGATEVMLGGGRQAAERGKSAIEPEPVMSYACWMRHDRCCTRPCAANAQPLDPG